VRSDQLHSPEKANDHDARDLVVPALLSASNAIQVKPRHRKIRERKPASARTTAGAKSIGLQCRTIFRPKMMPPMVDPLSFQRTAPCCRRDA
jgi:hypothetical protein